MIKGGFSLFSFPFFPDSYEMIDLECLYVFGGVL
jgi:hypothetical protein